MKGTILDYNMQKGEGVIRADDEKRYVFLAGEWRAQEPPAAGMRVDFELGVIGATATAIYKDVGMSPPPLPNATPPPVAVAPRKNQKADQKLAAGLCGILLGSLGVHKFILGYTTEGVIMLLLSMLSLFLLSPIIGIIGLVEGIIYLTKTDDDFVKTYVEGRRGWF